MGRSSGFFAKNRKYAADLSRLARRYGSTPSALLDRPIGDLAIDSLIRLIEAEDLADKLDSSKEKGLMFPVIAFSEEM